jgi:biopolymer transport protein TolR
MAFHSSSYDSSDEQRGDLAEINMVPMIDVMLVLLIIFMVAAPLSISGISIELPTSKAKGAPVDESKVILSIDPKGEYFLGKVPVPSETLKQKIAGIFLHREDKSLYIRADKKVAYGAVIDAMGVAKTAGVTKLSMLTTPPGKE